MPRQLWHESSARTRSRRRVHARSRQEGAASSFVRGAGSCCRQRRPSRRSRRAAPPPSGSAMAASPHSTRAVPRAGGGRITRCTPVWNLGRRKRRGTRGGVARAGGAGGGGGGGAAALARGERHTARIWKRGSGAHCEQRIGVRLPRRPCSRCCSWPATTAAAAHRRCSWRWTRSSGTCASHYKVDCLGVDMGFYSL